MLNANYLIDCLNNNTPIALVKFNDGELYAMSDKKGTNCDNHKYFPNLKNDLINAYNNLSDKAYLSEYSVRKANDPQWCRVTKTLKKPNDLFKEYLLLHDTNGVLNKDFANIYRAIAKSSQPKVLIAPKRINAERFLNVEYRIDVPLINAYTNIHTMLKESLKYASSIPNPLFIMCCGFCSCILASEILKVNPNASILDVGSGLDPLFPGCTRKNQVSQTRARNLYPEVSSWPNKVHYYEEIQGWFNYQDLFQAVVENARDRSLFVEIGCWKGKSTSFLATEIANCKKRIHLDVIDHFKGSASEQGSTHREAVYGNIQGQAINNLRPYWIEDNNKSPFTRTSNILKILPLSSHVAVNKYADKSIDFLFIDGEHTYAGVKADILKWLPKVKKGGIISGHDYGSKSFPGVKKAVDALLPGAKKASRNCWVYKVK